METPYELLDFGGGRKLERFGHWILDRPAPQAQRSPRAWERWLEATARFDADRAGAMGEWILERSPEWLEDAGWRLDYGFFSLRLRLAPQGQIGLFPEQEENWRWLREQITRTAAPVQVLNLFGYTGGSTLAAASAGAAVTHVDAASSSVAWARENARLSGLDSAPIRWITEDARLFVQRELRRGRRYQGIILDPPSFGRGPRGQVWKLTQHLPELLEACRELAGDDLQFFLLSYHTSGIRPQDIHDLICDTLGQEPYLRIQNEELYLRSRGLGNLSSGWAIRGTMG